MYYYTTEYDSPIGKLTLCSAGESLAGLWLAGQKYFGGIPGTRIPRDDLPIFGQVGQWLNRYFAGERPSPAELPLSPAGGAFRQKVWKILLEIPCGRVAAYGGIADKIGASPRAVGGAVGHNPISVIIPCHRVVGSNGQLTGYAGGIDKKLWLLEHEGADMDCLFVP